MKVRILPSLQVGPCGYWFTSPRVTSRPLAVKKSEPSQTLPKRGDALRKKTTRMARKFDHPSAMRQKRQGHASSELGTTSVWLESEVEAWIQSEVDERDQQAA